MTVCVCVCVSFQGVNVAVYAQMGGIKMAFSTHISLYYSYIVSN